MQVNAGAATRGPAALRSACRRLPLTGSSVNPARSLGPALITGGDALSQVWLFIVAPLVGGIAAAVVWVLLIAERPTEVAAGQVEPSDLAVT